MIQFGGGCHANRFIPIPVNVLNDESGMLREFLDAIPFGTRELVGFEGEDLDNTANGIVDPNRHGEESDQAIMFCNGRKSESAVLLNILQFQGVLGFNDPTDYTAVASH